MRTDHLTYFVAVAQHGSIAAAAAALGRSRSTLSMALSALEDDLGTPLFVRDGNSLTLGPAGSAILDDCHRVLALLAGIRQRSQAATTDGPQTLCLGRDDVLPEAFWRGIIRDLQAHFPTLELSMRYTSTEDLVDLVAGGAVDLAYVVAHGRTRPPLGLQARVVARIGMTMVAHRESPLAQLTYVADDDLAGLPQVTYLDFQQQQPFSLAGLGQRRIALSSFELVRDAILDGFGWGLIPEPLRTPALAADLPVLAHDLARGWFPYFAYSRVPLGRGGTGLVAQAHQLVDQALRREGIAV